MSVGFLGLELSAEHDFPVVGFAIFNGGTFTVSNIPPEEYAVTGLQSPGGFEFDYEVDVSNSMLHYNLGIAGWASSTFNGDVFSASLGTPPILGASVWATAAPGPGGTVPPAPVVTTDANHVYVNYAGQFWGGGSIDIQVSFTNPVADADSFAVAENTSIIGNVLSNDTDADGNLLRAALGSGPAHGSLTFDATGAFIYVPTSGYVGPDSFTYSITDGVASSTATVSLNVFHVNEAPVAQNDTATTAEDTAVNINVLANDTTPASESGQTLTVTAASALHGSVVIGADSHLTYTPASDYNGADT